MTTPAVHYIPEASTQGSSVYRFTLRGCVYVVTVQLSRLDAEDWDVYEVSFDTLTADDGPGSYQKTGEYVALTICDAVCDAVYQHAMTLGYDEVVYEFAGLEGQIRDPRRQSVYNRITRRRLARGSVPGYVYAAAYGLPTVIRFSRQT